MSKKSKSVILVVTGVIMGMLMFPIIVSVPLAKEANTRNITKREAERLIEKSLEVSGNKVYLHSMNAMAIVEYLKLQELEKITDELKVIKREIRKINN